MIFLDNRQDEIKVTKEIEDNIIELVDYALKEEKVNLDYELSIIFINNNEIRKINLEHRNIDRETDVLSFPMLEYPEGMTYKDLYIGYKFDDSYFDDGKIVLGDIAISLEKAKEQSEEYGHSFYREVGYLVIHSVLHLLGYDHIVEEDKNKMRKREEEILEKYNITR